MDVEKIREAFEKSISDLSYFDGFDESQWDIAISALSTIDPEAIRQELVEHCASVAVNYCEDDGEISGWTQAESGYLRAKICSILSADPAIESFTRDEVEVCKRTIGTDPAQDDGKAEVVK